MCTHLINKVISMNINKRIFGVFFDLWDAFVNFASSEYISCFGEGFWVDINDNKTACANRIW